MKRFPWFLALVIAVTLVLPTATFAQAPADPQIAWLNMQAPNCVGPLQPSTTSGGTVVVMTDQHNKTVVGLIMREGVQNTVEIAPPGQSIMNAKNPPAIFEMWKCNGMAAARTMEMRLGAKLLSTYPHMTLSLQAGSYQTATNRPTNIVVAGCSAPQVTRASVEHPDITLSGPGHITVGLNLDRNYGIVLQSSLGESVSFQQIDGSRLIPVDGFVEYWACDNVAAVGRLKQKFVQLLPQRPSLNLLIFGTP